MLMLRLLGSPEIELNDQPVTALTASKSLALLFYLALNGRALSRTHLAGLLWPEQPESNARVNLRRAIYLLGQALPDVVESTRTSVGLRKGLAVIIDARQFEAAVSAGLAGDTAALIAGVDAYSGDFLTAFYVDDTPEFEEWILVERERLRNLQLQGLTQLINQFVATREIGRGILYAGKLLALEPWREESHRQLMRLLAWDGQVQAALAQYERCRKLLRAELGVEPTAETKALQQAIRQGQFQPQDQSAPTTAAPPTAKPRMVDWGDAPALIPLHGRSVELAQLHTWITEEDQRLVAILGWGGQGKTALAATYARSHVTQFDVVLWRTLLNAPPLSDVLQNLLERLAPASSGEIPTSLDGKLDLLFTHLAQQRCLLILDNAESIMQGGRHAGAFQTGYEPYEQLLRRAAQGNHQSCLLLTSREKPDLFARLERQRSPVASLPLAGLDETAGLAILHEEKVRGGSGELTALVRQYSGNPLALILIADVIYELFDGDIEAYLAAGPAGLGDIQIVLVQQFARLTPLEEQITIWLAIEREPVLLAELSLLIQLPHTMGDLLTALRSLQRRSLIEKRGDGFTLQNVLLEFTTQLFVRTIVAELTSRQLQYFTQFALLKAQAKSYVRQVQERLFLKPVAQALLDRYDRSSIAGRLAARLASLDDTVRRQSYAGGNLLNLWLYLGLDAALDLSDTAVWQAFLRGKTLPPLNLSRADLSAANLTDYGGIILTTAFSHDGALLAGAAGTGEIRLWDTATQRQTAVIDGHLDFAGGLCFSPDNRYLVSGGGDGQAYLWDVATSRRLHAFAKHDNAVSAVAYGPAGTWIAGVSFNRLDFWDPVTGRILFRQKFDGHYLVTLAVSPDGTLLAVSDRNTVQLWDVPATLAAGKRQIRQELREHRETIHRLAFSPDGGWLAGSGDIVAVWDVTTGRCQHRLQDGQGLIYGLAFHPTEPLLAGGGRSAIYLWNYRSGTTQRAFAAHKLTIQSLAYAPDGRTLASSSVDGTVRLWNRNGQNIHTIQGFVNMVHTVDIAPNGRWLAAGTEDREVRLWDLDDGSRRILPAAYDSLVWRVVFSPSGRQLATCSQEPFLRVFSLPAGQMQYEIPTNSRPLTIGYSPDGQWLAAGDHNGHVSLWTAADGHRQQHWQHDSRACALAFHPQGHEVAVVCFDQNIYIWDIAAGRCRLTLSGHENEVWAVAYSRDGRYIVSGDDDNTIRVWDAAAGSLVHILTDHEGWVQTLAFDATGRWLVSGSQDRTIGLWDMAPLAGGGAPRLVRRLTGHSARVTAVRFTPDNEQILSSSLDESIRLWSPATGECARVITIPGPYTGVNITGVTGITAAQRQVMLRLGAVSDEPE